MLAEGSDEASVHRTAPLAGHDECFRAVHVFPNLSLFSLRRLSLRPAESQLLGEALGSRRHSQTDNAIERSDTRLGCGHADRLSARAFNGRAPERLVGRTRGLGHSPAGAVSPGARRSR